MIRFIKVMAVLLSLSCLAATKPAEDAKTTVRFRLLDTTKNRTTPAMVCITDVVDRTVRLPPEGKVCKEASNIKHFYDGISYQADHNWIGPVRMTSGKGKNITRSFVYKLKPSIPYWKEPSMFSVSGDFTIDLPAGRWKIAVEHGMEYVPVTKQFIIKPDDEAFTKTIELKRWINLPQQGWYSGDVHVHHPILKDEHRDFLLHYAEAEDVHVVNILEMGHHKGTNFRQRGFGKKFRARRGDYCLVAGQEEPRSTFGHIIGLNINKFVRDVNTYDYYDIAFRNIHKQTGALVGFAHLAWNGCNLPRGFPWYVITGELDFVELLQFRSINRLDYYEYLNLGFKLTATAGSDVPWGSTIGEVRTYVYTGAQLDIDAWFAGIKKGNTFVSNGPALFFTIDDRLPGTEMTKSPGDKVKVSATVLGHPKVGLPKVLTIVGNEGVVKEISNKGKQSELEAEFELSIEQSQWLVASTICNNNAVAHTTPIYIKVNGRGTWCPKRGPAVIEKQLKAIAKIEKEVTGKTDGRSQGILERLEKAKNFYAKLNENISQYMDK
ncbi:MAG: CehA/McbA family metallohydrolase [Planctomycetota bacterium]|jgi:hypothetical protein